MKRPHLIDATGRLIPIGEKIGSGGEGRVFVVKDQPNTVVKIYHQIPLAKNTLAKLKAMIICSDPDLARVSAWPRALVYESRRRRPCGMLMPKINDARPLHELYGTTTRRRIFPQVRWPHLVLAARNLAAAFDAMHRHKIVVGDVNQGNMLVDEEMRVGFIDCDSFQVQANDTVFYCPVCTPHFTPPELQSKRLDSVVRTISHDGFGMAVLIFHLLFVGRHPFAGRYAGDEDLPIERAISRRLFAFSKFTAGAVQPPPCSLTLDDIPPALASLFESALRSPSGNGQARPRAAQWVEQLDKLLKQRKRCELDPTHEFYNQLDKCPWCRIEVQGGPSYFLPYNRESTVLPERIAELRQAARQVWQTPFPQLDPDRLAVPCLPKEKPPNTRRPFAGIDVALLAWAISGVACLTGAFYGGSPVIAVATVLMMAGAGYLSHGREGSARRKTLADLRRRLAASEEKLRAMGQRIQQEHQACQTRFNGALNTLHDKLDWLDAEDEELERSLSESESEGRQMQQEGFLRSQRIRDNVGVIRGVTPQIAVMLEEYGIRSAYEAEAHMLYGIPNVSETIVLELVNWQAKVKKQFVYTPSFGVLVGDLQRNRSEAIRIFKLAQAQKVLIFVKETKGIVLEDREALAKWLADFDKEKLRWQEAADDHCAFQAGRRWLERLINRSGWTIWAVTLGVILLSAALWFVVG